MGENSVVSKIETLFVVNPISDIAQCGTLYNVTSKCKSSDSLCAILWLCGKCFTHHSDIFWGVSPHRKLSSVQCSKSKDNDTFCKFIFFLLCKLRLANTNVRFVAQPTIYINYLAFSLDLLCLLWSTVDS